MLPARASKPNDLNVPAEAGCTEWKIAKLCQAPRKLEKSVFLLRLSLLNHFARQILI